MKAIFFFLFSIVGLQSYAQLEKGFKKEEARDMIAICNSFTFLELFNSDSLILPQGYKKNTPLKFWEWITFTRYIQMAK
jgi:hypothetical protein